MTDERFSLASARQAGAEGRVAQWVLDFLSSPGSDNEALAASIAFDDPVYLGPVELELDRLTPMAGPDDDVVVPIAEEEWESDIGGMADSAEDGWQPPPLLVSHHDGAYLLEDGNHRCEMLRRTGATRAWAILVFAGEDERARFLAEEGSPSA